MTQLWQRSAQDLAALVATRQASSAEVVDAHLARIEAVNPALNAVVRVLAQDARAAAQRADRRVAAGESLGPLHGVPFTVKENIDVAGLPTTCGVRALADAVVPLDAPVVQRMRSAGAIAIARTNLPDMGLRAHTDSSLYGLTRNPWNRERTAAGSSGGEAVAITTGMKGWPGNTGRCWPLRPSCNASSSCRRCSSRRWTGIARCSRRSADREAGRATRP